MSICGLLDYSWDTYKIINQCLAKTTVIQRGGWVIKRYNEPLARGAIRVSHFFMHRVAVYLTDLCTG